MFHFKQNKCQLLRFISNTKLQISTKNWRYKPDTTSLNVSKEALLRLLEIPISATFLVPEVATH